MYRLIKSFESINFNFGWLVRIYFGQSTTVDLTLKQNSQFSVPPTSTGSTRLTLKPRLLLKHCYFIFSYCLLWPPQRAKLGVHSAPASCRSPHAPRAKIRGCGGKRKECAKREQRSQEPSPVPPHILPARGPARVSARALRITPSGRVTPTVIVS